MTRKWTTKYGLAAVVTAVLIISIAMFANPSIIPQQASAKSTFAVMLTDPPTVPSGTTVLNITYSDISLHITYANGSSNWVSVGASGTVNSFSLVNMSQTIASTTIPTNSTVDKIEFTITDASAMINGQTYNVTTLSNTLVMSVANSRINQTLSGVLIDFNPTLVQIQSTDADGNPVSYYVLVPSATAIVVNGLDSARVRVGTIVAIGQNDRVRISRVVESFAQNVTITAASLSVNGNQTTFSVTLQNQGDVTFRIFGLMLQGKFDSTRTTDAQIIGGTLSPGNSQFPPQGPMTDIVPFAIDGNSLVPLLAGPAMMQPLEPSIRNGPMMGMGGNGGMGGRLGPGTQPLGPQMGMHDDRTGAAADTYLALEPGQSVTLSFSGVIALQRGMFLQSLSTVVSPIVGNSYTVSLMGEGFATFDVAATA